MNSPEQFLRDSQKGKSQESSENLGGATETQSREQELVEKALSGMRLDTPVHEQKTGAGSSTFSIYKRV